MPASSTRPRRRWSSRRPRRRCSARSASPSPTRRPYSGPSWTHASVCSAAKRSASIRSATIRWCGRPPGAARGPRKPSATSRRSARASPGGSSASAACTTFRTSWPSPACRRPCANARSVWEARRSSMRRCCGRTTASARSWSFAPRQNRSRSRSTRFCKVLPTRRRSRSRTRACSTRPRKRWSGRRRRPTS